MAKSFINIFIGFVFQILQYSCMCDSPANNTFLKDIVFKRKQHLFSKNELLKLDFNFINNTIEGKKRHCLTYNKRMAIGSNYDILTDSSKVFCNQNLYYNSLIFPANINLFSKSDLQNIIASGMKDGFYVLDLTKLNQDSLKSNQTFIFELELLSNTNVKVSDSIHIKFK